MNRFARVAYLVLGALPAFASCGESADDGRLGVAVSVAPQQWLVERIGGPHVRVVSLVGPGEDPHTFQPSDVQITEVLRSRVYFRVGVGFEDGPWFDALSGRESLRLVDVREGLDLRGSHDHHHQHGEECAGDHGQDPHIWLSPPLLVMQAETCARVLAEMDPDHAGDYRTRLGELTAELAALDAELREVLGPVKGRAMYVFHPAWGYFTDTYGLTQVPIEIDGKEPSEAELTALIERARRDGVRTIYVESDAAGRTARRVAKVLSAEVVSVNPLAANPPEVLRSLARSIAADLK